MAQRQFRPRDGSRRGGSDCAGRRRARRQDRGGDLQPMTDRDTHAELQSELRDREEMAKRQAALSDRQPKQRWPYWPETICISAGLLCGILAWVANAKAAEY